MRKYFMNEILFVLVVFLFIVVVVILLVGFNWLVKKVMFVVFVFIVVIVLIFWDMLVNCVIVFVL